jgi:FkbM family methyltransferase
VVELSLSGGVLDWNLPVTHEYYLVNRFANKKIDTAVDIGAHVGTWTLRLALFCKRVVAFEPHLLAYKTLLKNLEINRINNVVAENLAVWNKSKGIKLSLYKYPSHSSPLEKHPMESQTGEKLNEVDVQAISLDDYLKKNDYQIDLIKIDVEGGEVRVVEGAVNTINKFRPNMCIETHSKENYDKILKMLPDFKFETFDNGLQLYLLYFRE